MMVETIVIQHPLDSTRRVEFFVAQPCGVGSWPSVIYVHGHQYPERPGGRVLVENGLLAQRAADGVLSVAISQPGYGQSDGPPDYCGAITQSAILGVIQYIIQQRLAVSERIALVGVSRGAIASSMVATQTPHLGALVVNAGMYDLAAGYCDCPWSGIRQNIETEAGVTEKAFLERSALHKAHLIHCPVLILHGANDDRISPEQAKSFATSLARSNNRVELIIYPDEGHSISRVKRRDTHIFINRHLKTSLPLN